MSVELEEKEEKLVKLKGTVLQSVLEQHPSYKSLASRTKSKDVVFLATLFLQIYLSVSDGDREKKKSVSVVVRSTDFNGKVDYKLPSKKERAQFENYVWGAFDFYHFMDAAKRIKNYDITCSGKMPVPPHQFGSKFFISAYLPGYYNGKVRLA